MTEPETNVVDLDAYRPPIAGPVDVTFIGHRFRLPDGGESSLTCTITIANGDFKGAIDAFQSVGGVFVPATENGQFWFLPWPPAAIRIAPVAAGTD